MTQMHTPLRGDVTVLIPAAGTGERMGMGPKALLLLDGRPVLEWVVRKAMRLADEVIVACPAGADPQLDEVQAQAEVDGVAIDRDGETAHLTFRTPVNAA